MTPTLETLRTAVEEVRRLAGEATQGDWAAMRTPAKSYIDHGYRTICETKGDGLNVLASGVPFSPSRGWVINHDDDARFIAHAPQMAALAVQLLEALEEAQGKWLPIESAPKDGTRILAARLFHDGSADQRTVQWEPKFEVSRLKRDCTAVYRGAWTDYAVASFGMEEYQEFLPTHWQALPAPPAPTQTGGQS